MYYNGCLKVLLTCYYSVRPRDHFSGRFRESLTAIAKHEGRGLYLKALANEDTLLLTHCCRHKCFPVCPSTHH